MSIFNKKKEAVQNEARAENKVNLLKEASDFEFVQLDSSIHDQKFQTKPTTYFKDALKRFVKSRAAVGGAIVLGVIMLMAIVVPLADQNDIDTPVASSQYLPPKWFDYNGGFMDGTEWESDIILDPDTKEPVDQQHYLTRAIIGGVDGISVTKQLTTGISPYGRGGDIALSHDTIGKDAMVWSPATKLDVTQENPTIVVSFDLESCKTVYAKDPQYVFAFACDFTSTNEYASIIDLTQKSKVDSEKLTISNAFTTLTTSSQYIAAGSPTSFSARLTIYLPSVSSAAYQTLYISSIAVQNAAADTQNDFSQISFSDATVMLNSTPHWDNAQHGSASFGVFNSVVLKGAFRYDPYNTAFGDTADTLPELVVNEFVTKGWMTYQWGDHPDATPGTHSYDVPEGAFSLTESGEIYCPIRSVTKEQVVNRDKKTPAKSLIVVKSLYRWDYYKGYIKTCEPPRYLFGTTVNGTDFFKIVFSGLFTSLSLGVLAALINVTIGVIWGSISGYFGGWTDILMERITEILGGMPWIVLMTLIILLLKSSFWTFLLALCITGWIGISSETRSQFYRYKGREYVLASRTLGASDWRLIFRHILPNGIGTIVTGVALIIPSVIFSEATISYLLPGTLQFTGAQSFGVTLQNAQGEISNHPYMIISASLVMVFIMISFNLFGNGLRDAFNPSLKGSNE